MQRYQITFIGKQKDSDAPNSTLHAVITAASFQSAKCKLSLRYDWTAILTHVVMSK